MYFRNLKPAIMKYFGKIGLTLGILTLAFGLYVMFVVAPASKTARSKMDYIISSNEIHDNQTYFDVPGYREAFETYQKKIDYSSYVHFASIVPFLLSIIGLFKKDKLAWIGVISSLGAFFIGAALGTHMFS